MVGLLLAFHYGTLCIDDNLLMMFNNQSRHFGHWKEEKQQIFMQQKTILLYFYFLFLGHDNNNKRPLRTIYLFLRNSRSSQKNIAGGLLLEHSTSAFASAPNYFSASLPFFQKQSPKETPEVVSQMCSSKRTLPELCQTTGFLSPVFSRIRTESLYRKIRKIGTRILL